MPLNNYSAVHVVSAPNPRKIMHTDIEYFAKPNGALLQRGYAWDFLTGCWHWQNGVCGGGGKDFKCWAKGLAEGRNKASYPFGFEPTLWASRLLDPLKIKRPSRIAVCFKGDLFGEWVEPCEGHGEYGEDEHGYYTLKGRVFETIESCPQHTFLFLTKNPAGYQAWGRFPDNCWCGVTIDRYWNLKGKPQGWQMLSDLGEVKSKNKWVSFEPVLEKMEFEDLAISLQAYGIKWVVVGGFSGGRKQPRIEHVREIVQACDKAGIPVWLKNNLAPLIGTLTIDEKWVWAKNLGYGGLYRQEFPKVEGG